MDRPFIQINCASTLDGRIAKPDGSRLRISCPDDMRRVHELRAEFKAIMVGAGTILADDPKLTVKERYVKNPPELVKIIIDGKGRIPADSRFLRTKGRSIIVTSQDSDPEWIFYITKTIEDEYLDAEMVILNSRKGRIDIKDVLGELKGMGIERIMVEGGSDVIGQFMEIGSFDIFTIYFGPMIIGGKGPGIVDGLEKASMLHLPSPEFMKLGEGILMEFSME